jgi:small redox-active disulfide protein 2
MDVKVLGTGCMKCNKLYEQVEQSIQQLGLTASLVKVERLDEIISYGVLATPALVINGAVKVAGRLPNAAELTSWLTTAATAG